MRKVDHHRWQGPQANPKPVRLEHGVCEWPSVICKVLNVFTESSCEPVFSM